MRSSGGGGGESPEQRAARQAEERRIQIAQMKADSQEITAMRRLQDRKTKATLRMFGGKQATAGLGGLGSTASGASGTSGASYDPALIAAALQSLPF